jgi:hypothetical protein
LGHSNALSIEMTANSRQFNKCFSQLEKLGLLLVSDAFFPSVYQLIAGESRKGSWWANEQAHTIFAVNEMLEDHPDVMVMKLISGKVTFIHRELWEHIYSIGAAREEWQLNKLSPAAQTLLKTLDEEEILQTNKLGKAFGAKPVQELELRMLAHAAQVHTESGKHAKVLKTWNAWASDIEFRVRAKSPDTARRFLEGRVAEINNNHPSANATLPWTAKV